MQSDSSYYSALFLPREGDSPLYLDRKLFAPREVASLSRLSVNFKKYKQTESVKQSQTQILNTIASMRPELKNTAESEQITAEKLHVISTFLQSSYKRDNPTATQSLSLDTLKNIYFANVAPSHVCSNHFSVRNGIAFVYNGRPFRTLGHVFICTGCGKFHICTHDRCDTRMVSKNNEAQICHISGREWGSIAAHNIPFVPHVYDMRPLDGPLSASTTISGNARPKRKPRRSRIEILSATPAQTPQELSRITSVVRNFLLPIGFRQACDNVILQRLIHANTKVSNDISARGYIDLAQTIKLFMESTIDVPKITLCRDSSYLLNEDLLKYLSSCVMHLQNIISAAPNAKILCEKNNLQVKPTIIALLYLLHSGLEYTLCRASGDCISKYGTDPRYPIKFLTTSSDPCGIKLTDSGTQMCVHTKISFIPRHRILDRIILPPDLATQIHRECQEDNTLGELGRISTASLPLKKIYLAVVSQYEPAGDVDSVNKFRLEERMTLVADYITGDSEPDEL